MIYAENPRDSEMLKADISKVLELCFKTFTQRECDGKYVWVLNAASCLCAVKVLGTIVYEKVGYLGIILQ